VIAFAIWQGTPSYPLAIVLTSLTTVFTLAAFMLWSAWRRGVLNLGQSSRHFWSIRVGHFLGMTLVPVLCWQLATAENQLYLLAAYPFWAVVTGVTFFPLGSNFWGRLYLFGLAAFAAAPLMALRLEWAPVELGSLVTIALALVSRHLRKIDD